MCNKLLLIILLCWLGIFPLGAQFIENKGQWPQQVAFRSDLPAGALWIEKNAFTWQFFDPTILEYLHPVSGQDNPSPICRQHAYRVSFEGNNAQSIQGKKPITPYYNYYLDSDTSKWASRCASYQRIDYTDIYEGIDLVVYTKNNAVKYDFIVHSGFEANNIAMTFDGEVDLTLQNGNLQIQTSINTITEMAPFAYQMIEGKIHEVDVQFVLNKNRLSFQVGSYNKSFDLVIDPEIVFSTFIGSTASNFGFTACDDNQGNLISGAMCIQVDIPSLLAPIKSISVQVLQCI